MRYLAIAAGLAFAVSAMPVLGPAWAQAQLGELGAVRLRVGHLLAVDFGAAGRGVAPRPEPPMFDRLSRPAHSHTVMGASSGGDGGVNEREDEQEGAGPSAWHPITCRRVTAREVV